MKGDSTDTLRKQIAELSSALDELRDQIEELRDEIRIKRL